MALGVSARELGRLLGVSDTAVRKAAKAKRIPQLADGTFDTEACRAAWAGSTDPARTKVRGPANPDVRTGSQPAVRTVDDARAAVALIAEVLQSEGVVPGVIDYNATRMAETILKARERALKIAQRRKELVPIADQTKHIDKMFIAIRQAWQRMPSRHVPDMAAQLGCDPALLDQLMSKAIAADLNEMSAPVTRV